VTGSSRFALESHQWSFSHLYVDNARDATCVRAPMQFDVLAHRQLFGDIPQAMKPPLLPGSIGMLPSASLGASGPGVFEPGAWFSPDIRRLDRAQTPAMPLSAAMLLRVGLKQGRSRRPAGAGLVDDRVGRWINRTGIEGSGEAAVGCQRNRVELVLAAPSNGDLRQLRSPFLALADVQAHPIVVSPVLPAPGNQHCQNAPSTHLRSRRESCRPWWKVDS